MAALPPGLARGLAGVLAAASLAGCVTETSHAATVPDPPRTAAEGPRRAFYEKYSLTRDGDVWKRGDERYDWKALADVSKQYPETEDIYDRANTRATVLTFGASLGGALVGSTLGWNLAASDANRMSSGAQITLYSVGGAIAVLSILAAVVWHNPSADLADTYNGMLRRQLALPADSTPGTSTAP